MNIHGKDKFSNEQNAYRVYIFGVTDQNKSISLTITDFRPYFYIKKDSSLQKIYSCLEDANVKGFDLTTVKRKEFLGFTNDTLFDYICCKFDTNYMMKKAVDVLHGKNKIYEGNLESLLRCVHDMDIDPAGWIYVDDARCYSSEDEEDEMKTTCQLQLMTNWRNVRKAERSDIGGMKILTFDIECFSSNGEFPVAIKTFRRPASILYDEKGNTKKALEWIDRSGGFKTGNKLEAIKHFNAIANAMNWNGERDYTITTVCENLEKKCKLHGDPIIQIGLVLRRFGSTDVRKVLLALHDTKVDNSDIEIQ
jgi:DNA polymerase elongation subunit (family B)